jgi:hypothetical protein
VFASLEKKKAAGTSGGEDDPKGDHRDRAESRISR